MSTLKINFGIIGFGLFAENYLIPAFQKISIGKILAITKQNLQDARQKADKYGIKYAYAYLDKNDLLQRPDINAVYVATPNNCHHDDTIDALEAGKHVILEKPMAMNAKECEEIISAAQANNRILMIAHCLRFNKTILHIKALIESGAFGKLISGTCDFMSEGKKSTRPWKYNKRLAGGGAAFDLGVHVIDTLRFLAGSSIKKVFHSRLPDPLPPDQVDDFASFMMTFENGFIGRANSSYEGPRHTYIEIYGTKGYIRAFDWNLPNTGVRVESEIEGELKEDLILNDDNYARMIETFCSSIQNQSESPVSGQEGLINQSIIDLVNI